jgi:NADPH2:quinone reductase
MRALQQTSFDGPDDLRLIEDATVPKPGPDEVLIRVTAAAANWVDVAQSRSVFPDGPRPPYIAGIEAAGEVVAIGDAVSAPAIGDHVVGLNINGGAFAEFMALPAAASIPVPDGWDDDQALGLMVSWPTAVAALKPIGQLKAGQVVLIHAAAGGTGQAAVRIAKRYGAIVIAAASAEKHGVLHRLGADHIVDSRSSDLTGEIMQLTGGAGVDLVLESVGGATLEVSMAAAKPVTGRVVVFGLSAGAATVSNWDLVYRHRVHLIGLNVGSLMQSAPQIFGEVMTELFGLLVSGVLPPVSPTTYGLADGPRAMSDLEGRRTVGKTALIP